MDWEMDHLGENCRCKSFKKKQTLTNCVPSHHEEHTSIDKTFKQIISSEVSNKYVLELGKACIMIALGFALLAAISSAGTLFTYLSRMSADQNIHGISWQYHSSHQKQPSLHLHHIHFLHSRLWKRDLYCTKQYFVFSFQQNEEKQLCVTSNLF